MSKKGVIRILEETFSIWEKCPLIFVLYLGLAVLSLFLLPIIDPQEVPILDYCRRMYSGGWAFLLDFIEIFIVAMVITMTYTFHREKVSVPLQEALGSVRSKVLHLIGAWILRFLILLIIALIGLVPMMMGGSLESTVLKHIGELIFFALLVLVSIFFAFVYQGVIIDNMGVTETFKNSYRIAKDNFWTIIGIGLVAFILFTIFLVGVIGIISVIHEVQTSIIIRIFRYLLDCYLTVALTLLYISRKPGKD